MKEQLLVSIMLGLQITASIGAMHLGVYASNKYIERQQRRKK